MNVKTSRPIQTLWIRRALPRLLAITIAASLWGVAEGQTEPPARPAPDSEAGVDEKGFGDTVEPFLRQYCVRCHHADVMKSGVRVDQLSASPADSQLKLWERVLEQVDSESMPPDDEPQPSNDQRAALGAWVRNALKVARSRPQPRNGSLRRLTVVQYRNTLRDLLGLAEDLTESLPPDGVSKDGFTNHDKTLLLSPLQVESYFEIASQALDRCLVDEKATPVVQTFRMELGKEINAHPCPDKLILGANSELLENRDFVVSELAPLKPFHYQPFAMRTKYRFIEGYAGNDTVRDWRDFDSIYHAVFACVRGTPGYPRGEAYQVVPEGLLLRPAIPSPEVFGSSNTYGPMANFKISLRELPDHGNFRVTVRAARYPDGMLLEPGEPSQGGPAAISAELPQQTPSEASISVAAEGIYQVDVGVVSGMAPKLLRLQVGSRSFSGQLAEPKPAPTTGGETPAPAVVPIPFLILRLPAGSHRLSADSVGGPRPARLTLTRLENDHPLAVRFQTFEQRLPSLGVHLGLRRDCGSTLAPVGSPQRVSSEELREYTFEGPISDFPSPDVELDNVNYLAGVREIGVRSEYTDGRILPRLLIRSIEFEGPFYTQWPPETHRRIFIDSAHRDDPPTYAREVIRAFATRAFRRPVTDEELGSFIAVWEAAYAAKSDFQQAVRDALVVVLTSPQFLFLVEASKTPEGESLEPYELASKLSYFLWNSAPDARLLELARENRLQGSLDAEIDRMVADPRFEQFLQPFVSQWLSLEKFDVVAVDGDRFPQLTRDVKRHLRQEPIELVQYLIRENLPLRHLVQSDFILANEVVASYYGLGDRVESGFQFVPLRHSSPHLGGVLSQASILSGLSDGREANPVKRGAWLARKIISEPPDDPPPNVPPIPQDEGSGLTLREKLERHRSQPGCAKCHSGIDPWGLPFEQYSAAGLFLHDRKMDARSLLPDGAEVADLNGLKEHLAGNKLDRVAFSFVRHLATYATGRTLTYQELAFLERECAKFRSREYRALDLIRWLVKCEVFLLK